MDEGRKKPFFRFRVVEKGGGPGVRTPPPPLDPPLHRPIVLPTGTIMLKLTQACFKVFPVQLTFISLLQLYGAFVCMIYCKC